MSRVLVTGGSGGIGEAVVRRLAAAGADVVFTFCAAKERAEAVADETGARPLHYDQSAPDSIGRLEEEIRAGAFDALVNNGAQAPARKLLLKTDPAAFMAYQAASIEGALRLSQAHAAQIRERGASGSIVNVLTSYVLGMPPAKLSAYVTSKYALLGLTRSMAVEFIRYGVRVNAVSPSVTRTSFIADLPERFIEQLEAGLPMERLATPEEVAAVIQFLISPEASYINGANVPVAGGQTC